MSARLILYFTAAGHTAYRWRGGAMRFEAQFSPDDTGIGRFREYLKGRQGALVHLVADLAGEDFHEDRIPYLRGADRQIVIERRLAQRYRDTRLAAALSLGYVADERRNERLLLASFSNTQQFVAWLDALDGAHARLAGVYSTPLLAPVLAARLGVRSGSCFVVSLNHAGLRQCFIENGRLRFSRLERTADTDAGALPAFVRTETERMLQYLGTLRALPRDGPAMRVIVIVPEEHRARFEQALGRDARLTFRTVGMTEAARAVGLRRAPAGSAAELLYLQLVARQPPRDQFARGEERHSYMLWRLQRSIVAAGALGFAACAAYAAAHWLDALTVREQVDALRFETRQAREQFQRVSARFPVTPTTTENLKAAALEFRSIAARGASPEGALAHVSRVLDQAPQIELDALAWSAGPGGDAKSDPAPAANPSAAPAEPAQTVEISGRVNVTQRSDYRSIAEQVQRFAALLGADPGWRVVRTQLPFDITPEGTLSGDISGAADAGEMPRFSVSIARRQQ